MLRIGVQEERESASFTIEGKLTGLCAIELERCWQRVVAVDPRKTIVVNLAAVTFVDAECRELLIRMRRQGVRLVPTGCLMRAMVDQIESDVAREHQARDFDLIDAAQEVDDGTVRNA